MNIWDILTKETYTQGALWANKNNAHIEMINGQYVIVPNPTVTLEEAKQNKISELKSIRDTKEVALVEYNGYLFDYDDKAQKRINVAYQCLQANKETTVMWTTADNNDVEMTFADFEGLLDAVMYRSNQLHIKYRELKEMVNSCETVEEVNEIGWETEIKTETETSETNG